MNIFGAQALTEGIKAFGNMATAGIQGIANYGASVYNNEEAYWREQQARKENYEFGERAAWNADTRTRKLYNDLYSPQAQLEQIKAAGLSPSLFYGDGGGISGQAGAQGTGTAGIAPTTFGLPPIDVAAITKMNAETDKIKEETKNISIDSKLKELQKSLEELKLGQFKNEWDIINSTWTNPETGKETSIFELADDHYSYDSFLAALRTDGTDPEIKAATTTEAGQKLLRGIYTSASKFNRDISVLSSEQVTANFQIELTNKLKEQNFASLNAEAAVQELKTLKATNELTQNQKDAWNDLLDRLGKKGSTTRDILTVVGMILGSYVKNANVKIFTGGQVTNNNKFITNYD